MLIIDNITFVKLRLWNLLLFVNTQKCAEIIKLPCSPIKAALFFWVLILTIFVVPIFKLRWNLQLESMISATIFLKTVSRSIPCSTGMIRNCSFTWMERPVRAFSRTLQTISRLIPWWFSMKPRWFLPDCSSSVIQAPWSRSSASSPRNRQTISRPLQLPVAVCGKL